MSVVLDETEQKNAAKNSKMPSEKAAWLVVNNKLWLFALCLLLVDVYQGWSNKRAFDAAMNTKELIWIKMGADGNSTVENFAPGDQPTFYKASVDSALERYLSSRYGVQPETIKKDYGIAGVFMSQPMYNDFLSTQKGGFNAVQKAADIQANGNSVNRVEIKWGFPNHYDSLPAVFGKDKVPGEMFKSNVYFTEVTKSPSGILVKDGVKQKIWRGEWHFLTKKELSKKSKEWLRANPVGIEIIKADVIDDPAGNEREEAK